MFFTFVPVMQKAIAFARGSKTPIARFDALADLYERYIPLLQDPSSAVTAVDGFLAELVTVSEASTAAELTLVDLAVDLLKLIDIRKK